jgi:uncharacterized membrane protein YdfJ with MMPL/SSD domain
MQRLAALVYRRRRTILGAWIAALVAAVAFIFIAGDALTPRQELPGSESVLAGKRLSREFGIPRSEPIQLVLRASTPLAAQRPSIERLVAATRAAFPGRQIDSPLESATGASAIGPSGLVGYINIPFDDQLEAQDSVPLARRTVAATTVPFTVLVSGGPVVQLEMNPALRHDLVRAELVAGALSLIVLVVVLGSVVAGMVPLLLALFVIPIVLSIVFALSHVTDVTVFAPNVVTLVGLGIAIDYSLLVVYRFREELAVGRAVDDAVAATMRTAVRAVVFSGVTVGIGLGVLLLVRVPFVQSFGLAGILIPIVTILAALTLLPALMATLGHRINRWRVVPESVLAASESRPWRRIAEQIMRAPLVFLLVGGAVIAVAAAPVRDLALGSTPLAVYPNTGPGSEGVKLLAAEFGSGGVAPVRILVDLPVADVERALPGIRAATGVRDAVIVPGPTGTLVNTFGDDEVGSAASNELVRHLRHTVLPGLLPAGSYAVGGGPAVFYDFQQALYGDFGWIALIVIVATMLVLFRAFRSLLLPLKAVLMNGLSVAGAYGLLVAVFQHGVGADLVGFHRTEQIAVWIPLFLFAFLFGLSMDYEVFLLARMREEYDAVPDNTRAVAAGLAKTGKLITSAALIMVIAFCGLAASRFIEMQQFGFGLAAAILLDATLIRALIVPSLMKLMGRGNWWLPAPLRPLAGRRPADRA